MDVFQTLRNSIRISMEKLRKDPSMNEIIQAISMSGDWDALENRLYELRTISRKRQQEILDRLEPLADRVEELLAEAKKAKFKIKRQNLLRQADDLMRELEAEDEPAQLYSVNGQMLTKIIMQVRKARAMSERGVDAQVVDQVAAAMDSIVVQYEDLLDASADFESVVNFSASADSVASDDVEERLRAVYEPRDTQMPQSDQVEEHATGMDALEDRLYEANRTKQSVAEMA